MKVSCQEQLLPGETLPEKWEAALAAGFAGIELRARDGFDARLPELRAAAAAGIPMPTVCPDTDHFLGDFDAARRADAVEQLRRQIDVMAEIGGSGLITPASWGMFSTRLPPFTPPRPPAEDFEVLVDGLCALAGPAAEAGVWIAVEPINRYEDHMVNRLEQAVALGEEVERRTGHRSIRVLADLYHMNIEEDDLAAALVATGDRLAHVHVDDSNRLQPGTGHIDFAAVFGALRAIGYDGWYALECRLRGPAPEALAGTTAFLSRFADA